MDALQAVKPTLKVQKRGELRFRGLQNTPSRLTTVRFCSMTLSGHHIDLHLQDQLVEILIAYVPGLSEFLHPRLGATVLIYSRWPGDIPDEEQRSVSIYLFICSHMMIQNIKICSSLVRKDSTAVFNLGQLG